MIFFGQNVFIKMFCLLITMIKCIHSKSGYCSADNLNFLQKDGLITQKLSILQYACYAFLCIFIQFKHFYAFLSNLSFFMQFYAFSVAIYTLFLQIFRNWKADSSDFIAFRMYDQMGNVQKTLKGSSVEADFWQGENTDHDEKKSSKKRL